MTLFPPTVAYVMLEAASEFGPFSPEDFEAVGEALENIHNHGKTAPPTTPWTEWSQAEWVGYVLRLAVALNASEN